MPVEIRELIIRASVDVESGRADDRDPDEEPEDRGRDDRQALVQACVRQVLRILETSRER